jgi:hypothetical protein
MSLNVATGTTPWHMWGNKKTVNATLSSLLGAAVVTTEQLANVQAKRPDTWRFFLVAQLNSMVPAVAPGIDQISVDFDLTFGLGLATQVIPGFAHFEFDPSTDIGRQIWTCAALGPKRTATDVASNQTTEIVAQTIQCNARLQLNGAILGVAQLEVAAFFAPNVHVRPDWFLGQFDGNETGGR